MTPRSRRSNRHRARFATSARSTSSPRGCAVRTSMSGEPTSGSPSSSRAPTSTELGRRGGGGWPHWPPPPLDSPIRAAYPGPTTNQGVASVCGRTCTEGLIRRTAALVLLAGLAMLSMSASAGATPLDYRFNGTNEDWQQSQDNGDTVTSAGFAPSGGNPGGHLRATDTGPENGCSRASPCDLLTFFSPAVPPLGANYGGIGSFDLRSSVNPAFAAELLLLPTGNE